MRLLDEQALLAKVYRCGGPGDPYRVGAGRPCTVEFLQRRSAFVWRGCVWSGVGNLAPRGVGWIDAFAAGSEHGGCLGTFNRANCDWGLDALFCFTVSKYATNCFGRRGLGPFGNIMALDGVPWEIHCIEDQTAYFSALEAYRAQSSL